MSDLISRQAALDAMETWDKFGCDPDGKLVRYDDDKHYIPYVHYEDMVHAIKHLPSAQPGQRNARVFQGIIVEYPSISAYPEYEGKPYFSIKYTENGQEFIGYGTYKPEVLSEFLKEYFMPSAQPRCEDAVSRFEVLRLIDYSSHDLNDAVDNRYMQNEIKQLPSVTPKQPGWIPWGSGRFPEESGTYTVTAYDGTTKRVTYAKYQKRLKRWELTGARAYWKVVAWMPLPKPWEGDTDAH